MVNKKSNSEYIKKLVMCGVFSALAYACVLVFRIKVSFLTLDLKDAVTTTAAMLLGPVYGIVISLIVAFIEMVTISETVFYGFIMNFLSSATLSCVASLVYRQKKTLLGAVLGLASAAVAVTAVMLAANLFITPFYMSVPRGEVVNLIPRLLLPFNLTKAILNSSIVMIIYKPISDALRRAGFLKKRADDSHYKFGKRSIAVTLTALVTLAAALVVFFSVLGGKIQLF